MRMEELSEHRYIKSTDTVERYLLELVRTYFEGSGIAQETSREYIIKKAVERMKEELSLDGMGVTAVVINGEQRTGAVLITLEDLGGEPAINPKHTAFNVDFGNEKGTACEGNDPRLSDARKPLPHQHQISDIIGLEGILSTLTGKVERVNGLSHTHANKNVLDMLVYTGSKSVIDLTILDNLSDKISDLVDTIRKEIASFKDDINKKIQDIDTQFDNVEIKIEELRDYIVTKNNEAYQEAVEYTDTKYEELKEEFQDYIDGFVEKEQLNGVLEAARNSMSLVGSFEQQFSDLMDLGIYTLNRSASYAIPVDILQDITDRGVHFEECQIEFLIKFTDDNGKQVYAPLPYIVFNSGTIDGSLQVSNDSNTVYVSYICKSGYVSNTIRDAVIICNIYSRQDVTI